MVFVGVTIHSALGVGITLNPPAPHGGHVRAWSPIGILFLDEFSMCAPGFFDLLDSRLCLLKGTAKRFGGLHLVLTGDFFQVRPNRPLRSFLFIRYLLFIHISVLMLKHLFDLASTTQGCTDIPMSHEHGTRK